MHITLSGDFLITTDLTSAKVCGELHFEVGNGSDCLESCEGWSPQNGIIGGVLQLTT